MNPVTLIAAKRDGKELAPEHIRAFILGVAAGEIPDYQASAFLMATYFMGMSLAETVALTEAMIGSGTRYDLSDLGIGKGKLPVDKHSTGGVGDKVSLILAPLAAACGAQVPMMAGRGLGHSGGTIDKLEAIPGFKTRLDDQTFRKNMREVGCVIIGQSESMVPADRKLYALRDVTATIECVPLITASILSKKIAEGAKALVLDVKVGSGAFMKTKEGARKLARSIVQVGRRLGIQTRAVITDMNQPLGCASGNAVEVIECIEVLRGVRGLSAETAEGTSTDLRELTVQLCAHMLETSGISKSLSEGRRLAHAKLSDGSAWKKFQEMVRAQSGSLEHVLHPEKLARTKRVVPIKALKKGFIVSMDTQLIGETLVEMGGGRLKTTDQVDPAVGIVFAKKLGAAVKVNDTIAYAMIADRTDENQVVHNLHRAIEIKGTRKPVGKLILEVI